MTNATMIRPRTSSTAAVCSTLFLMMAMMVSTVSSQSFTCPAGIDALTAGNTASLPIADSRYSITVSSSNGARGLRADNTASPLELALNEFHTITVTSNAPIDNPTPPMTGLHIRMEAVEPQAVFEVGSTLLVKSQACENIAALNNNMNVQGMETRPFTTNSWAVAWLWSGSTTIIAIDITLSTGGYVMDPDPLTIYHSTYYVSFGGAVLTIGSDNSPDDVVIGRGDEVTGTPTAAPSSSPTGGTDEPTGLMERLQDVIIENDPEAAEQLGLLDDDDAVPPDGVLIAATESPTASPVTAAPVTAAPVTPSPTTSSPSTMPSDMPSDVPSSTPTSKPVEEAVEPETETGGYGNYYGGYGNYYGSYGNYYGGDYGQYGNYYGGDYGEYGVGDSGYSGYGGEYGGEYGEYDNYYGNYYGNYGNYGYGYYGSTTRRKSRRHLRVARHAAQQHRQQNQP